MVLGPGGKGNSGDDQASDEYLSKVDNELKVL